MQMCFRERILIKFYLHHAPRATWGPVQTETGVRGYILMRVVIRRWWGRQRGLVAIIAMGAVWRANWGGHG